MRTLFAFVAVGLFMILVGSSASAGFFYKLDASETLIASGDTVTFDLSLVDTIGTIETEGGLIGAGGRLLVEEASTAASSLGSKSDVFVNPAFAFPGTAVIFPFDPPDPFLAALGPEPTGLDNIAGFSAITGITSPPVLPSGPALPSGFEYLLASFDVVISGSVGSSATFLGASLGDPFFESNASASVVIPDSSVGDSAAVTVTIISAPVPEPTSLAIWACVIGGVGLRRRRRR